MVVTVNACVFSYVCFECLGDVWNVRVLTNHNMHKSTYNQFVIANMENYMQRKWYYHRKYVSCMHTSTHMLIRLEHVNHFFFHSEFLGGPQLNLWKRIRGKIMRSKSYSKLKYKPFVCFACIKMATTTPTSSSRKLFENEKIYAVSGKRPVLAVVLSSQKKVKGIVPTEIQCGSYWLDFQSMNTIAINANMPLIQTPSLTELVKRGMCESETHKMVESSPSFPFVE